ncbi:vacuolar protein sorting-associated 35A-like protein [Actinidia rufa]|uniref:Vacuolar protein sorting-associated 35A-like protein n=1 Tax=Actinidia rufa TaxID=165716 RepID=A0A7J0END7_9ERIC|nr:vacuolar protein sorting-associated 35A-like protein [Actinidia rufa]
MRAFDELRKLEMFFKEETRRGCSIIDLYELVQHAGNILPRLDLDLGDDFVLFVKEMDVIDVAPKYVVYRTRDSFACLSLSLEVLERFIGRPATSATSSNQWEPTKAEVKAKDIPQTGLEQDFNDFKSTHKPVLLDSELIHKADMLYGEASFSELIYSRGCSDESVLEWNGCERPKGINCKKYLLCTVGSVYIKSKEAPAKDVLKDLVEMCRGIQHPVRGLFLRSYLSQISRDKLPDIGSEYEGDADTVTDAVEFVLQNFTEMNKLWVRMQHQGPAREKERREKERSELRDLVISVGKNLHVLSQIEGVDLDMYRDTVLPRILEQVIEAQVDMPIAGAVTLYSSLLTFTLHVHPDRLDYVDQILGACVKKLSGKGKLDDSRATKQIVALLSAPLEKYNDIETALKLSNYPRVMEHLDDGTNKVMAGVIIQSIIKNRTHISTADKVEALFELIKGLIKDSDEKLHDEIDEEDFNEEQNSVARLIQMLYNNDPEEMLKIICTVRKYILTGGPKRLPFTVPPLIFNSLKLVRRLQSQEENAAGEEVAPTPKKIFPILNQFYHNLRAHS